MLKKILLTFLSFLMLFGAFAGVGAMIISAKETMPTYAKQSVADKVFFETSMKDILKKFERKENFYVFFGFENCPWCKEAKPILKRVAKASNIKIYYVKTRDKDGNRLYSEKQRKKLVKYIPDFMKKNSDENNKLWLYVPLLVKVKCGHPLDGHQGTIKGHNAQKRKMAKEEKQKLLCIYKRVIEAREDPEEHYSWYSHYLRWRMMSLN